MSNDLLRDLQKLSGAIDRHQGTRVPGPSNYRPPSHQPRHNTYVNPNYKVPPQRTSFNPPVTQVPLVPYPSPSASKDLTIEGVAFKASKNKLTRKDAPAPASTKPISSSYSRVHPAANHWNVPRPPHSKPYYPSHRGAYKPRGARGARNRVLKTGRHLRSRKLDKQCPFFTKTGSCARGTKCLYQHDPDKIAICPKFLRGDCPFSRETCQLSHEATPNRAPLCIHFANSGRCKNGENCVYPHYKVAPRTGVCKDFAVLGYCDKGIDCDKQHLKECPAFAETGVCHIKKCKLPHVIRANATRLKKAKESPSEKEVKPRYGISFSTMAPEDTTEETLDDGVASATPDDADYIPLTFEESDEESYSESDNAEERESEGGGEEHDEGGEEVVPPDSPS